MRIALDCRSLTGAWSEERACRLRLARALGAVDAEGEYYLYTAEATPLTDLPEARLHPLVLPASPRWSWLPLALPRDLARRGMDLLHVWGVAPPILLCPVVTTISDAAFRRFPERFSLPERVLLDRLTALAVAQAAAVLTGTEWTRQELIEGYGAPPEKVTVTRYAPEPGFAPLDRREARRAVRSRLRVPVPYLLAPAGPDRRLDLPALLRAYHQVAGAVQQRLVLLGRVEEAEEETLQAVAAVPAAREPLFTGRVAEADLPALFAGADLFVLPARYERSGILMLNAMACGTPVLAWDAPGVREIGGEAAALADPRDEAEPARLLRALLSDERRRERLSEAGARHASGLTWEQTARETVQAYRSAAGTDSGNSQPGNPAAG